MDYPITVSLAIQLDPTILSIPGLEGQLRIVLDYPITVSLAVKATVDERSALMYRGDRGCGNTGHPSMFDV